MNTEIIIGVLAILSVACISVGICSSLFSPGLIMTGLILSTIGMLLLAGEQKQKVKQNGR